MGAARGRPARTGSWRSTLPCPGCATIAAGCPSLTSASCRTCTPTWSPGSFPRLATIDPAGRNLAGRLIDSAIGHAAGRYRHRSSDPLLVAVDPQILTDLAGRLPRLDDDDGAYHEQTLQGCLTRYVNRLRAVGARLPDLDVELIALTRLDGVPVNEAAAQLGIPTEVAYKRRRRAEQRLAQALAGTINRPFDHPAAAPQPAVTASQPHARQSISPVA